MSTPPPTTTSFLLLLCVLVVAWAVWNFVDDLENKWAEESKERRDLK